jgi:hypothetical protein
MAIKVRATRTGFYGQSRYRKDAEFDIADEKDFSPVWMEKVDLLADIKLPDEPDGDEKVEEEEVEDPETGQRHRRPRRKK